MNLWELADLSTPWCIHVASTLRIADHIEAGKSRIADLAAAAGADPESLQRVLRHLVSKGIFEEPDAGVFVMNDASRGFHDEGLQLGLDLDSFGGRMAHAWSTLLQAVRTGKPAYHEVFGRNYWEDLEANPEIAQKFDLLMGPGHGTPDPDVLPDPAEWASVRVVVDVGGGTGMLLAEILRSQPHIRGVLVDLPRVVERSTSVFAAAGVADRVTTVGQSFFEPLPAGADIYLLKSVLSDWADEEARSLLRRCADASRPSGRVVLLNGVTPHERASPELLMMVLVGGKDRTLSQFRDLAREAGLEVRTAARQTSGRFIVECVPNLD
jgi:SAM-dependent methyltransferase